MMATHRFPRRFDSHYLIGMLHLQPLFGGSGSANLEATISRALADAELLADAGFDAVMLENFGDRPFYPQGVPVQTVAAMTRIAAEVQAVLARRSKPPALGINVLRNDAHSAVAIAAATGASLIRVNVHAGAMVTDQGLIEGRAWETVRLRDQLAPGLAIFADLRVKHAAPLVERPLEEEAEELWKRAGADALILSGTGTGKALDQHALVAVRNALPDCPLVVGSGARIENLPQLLPYVDALIVGSSLKVGNDPDQPIDGRLAKEFVRSVRRQ